MRGTSGQVGETDHSTSYATLDSFLEVERLAAVQLESSRFAVTKAEQSNIHKKRIDACHKKDLKIFYTSQEQKSKMSSCFICKGSQNVFQNVSYFCRNPV